MIIKFLCELYDIEVEVKNMNKDDEQRIIDAAILNIRLSGENKQCLKN